MERQRANGISYFTGGEGETLLMLHGIPGSAYTWHAVAERLSAQYRVIVPDLPGFGASDAPPHEYYMDEHARALIGLLEALGVRDCVFCGADFGGPVAFTLRRLDPQRGVRAMVVCNTNLFTDTFVPLPLRVAGVPGLGRAFYHLAFGTRAGNRMLYRAAAKQKQAVPWSQFQRHLTPGGLRSTAQVFHRSLKDLAGNYRAVEDTLKALDVPLLVLWGGADPLFGVDVGQRVADTTPHAEIMIFPNTGHFVPEEQPEQVAARIDAFLRGA